MKKKKKSKHSEEDNTEATLAVGDERVVCSEEDILSSTKKKHKKKRHHDTDSEDITINTNQLDIQLLSDSQPPAMDESVIRKKKKSKKKLSGMCKMYAYVLYSELLGFIRFYSSITTKDLSLLAQNEKGPVTL